MLQMLTAESHASESSAGPPSLLPLGPRSVDVASIVRQASTSVKVHQLLRSGKKDILLLSQEKVAALIRLAVRNLFEKTRSHGPIAAAASWKRSESESRQEFDDLRGQHERTAKAEEDLVHSKRALDTALQDMRDDLAQQRELADGRLPADVERAMVEKRFETLYAHLCALDSALGTLFSSRLYSYRQIQTLLRQATIARKAASLKPRNPSVIGSPPAVEKVTLLRGQIPDVAEGKRRIEPFHKLDLDLGRGLDVGTSTICAAARKAGSRTMVSNIQRNAFLDVRDDAFGRKLEKYGINYVVRGERGYIVGDPAFEFANIFALNIRRPMKEGGIASDEPDAILILEHLVEEILGPAREVGEICVFSVPGEPIDDDRNFIYHRSAVEKVLSNMGYTPRPMLESHLIVFSELKEQEYTGIGLSCGGGMVNVCVAYKGVPTLAFSTMRGGDWIDGSVAAALGMSAPQVCAVKEGGMDLANPKGRVEEAVAIYYRHFIRYTLEMLKRKMEGAQNLPSFAKPLHLVFAGGTAMITGFVEMFREEFEKVEFPIEVSEIRTAGNPLTAVSAGCLQAALAETRALGEGSDDVASAVLERAAICGIPKAAPEGAILRAGLLRGRVPLLEAVSGELQWNPGSRDIPLTSD